MSIMWHTCRVLEKKKTPNVLVFLSFVFEKYFKRTYKNQNRTHIVDLVMWNAHHKYVQMMFTPESYTYKSRKCTYMDVVYMYVQCIYFASRFLYSSLFFIGAQIGPAHFYSALCAYVFFPLLFVAVAISLFSSSSKRASARERERDRTLCVRAHVRCAP
jgi:hypothetical protein